MINFAYMKVAVITSGILPVPAVEGGAVEHLTEYYIEENERTGKHEITVFSVAPHDPVCCRKYKHTRFVNINVTTFLSRVRRVLFCKYHKCYFYHPYVEYFLSRILKRVQHGGYDIVVLENRPAFAPALHKISGAKILIHLHTDTINSTQPLASEWLENADGVIAISDYIRRRVLQVKPNMNVSVVYNGIQLETFMKAKPIERNKFGFLEKDFVLVYCGRVIPEKGIEQVIEAMLMLRRNRVNVKLLVIGSSFYGTDKHLDAYVAKMQTLADPIKESIHFTGYVSYDQIPCFLKACDVAVLPSLCEEAFGLTMLEAMACALPVITTNAGGIPEVCEGASIVLKRDRHLADNIAASIRTLMMDQETLFHLKQEAFERCKSFSLERYTSAMLSSIE